MAAFIFVFYFVIIPIVYNGVWYEEGQGDTFISWYFKKPECITWFGYIVFLLMGMSSLFYVLFYKTCEAILNPILWFSIKVFKFLFIKDKQ